MNGNRASLLRAVQEQEFTLNELNLFLDTHPDCAEAFAAYRQALENAAEARRQFESEWGPLTAWSVGDRYAWVDCPWPWEKEAN